MNIYLRIGVQAIRQSVAPSVSCSVLFSDAKLASSQAFSQDVDVCFVHTLPYNTLNFLAAAKKSAEMKSGVSRLNSFTVSSLLYWSIVLAGTYAGIPLMLAVDALSTVLHFTRMSSVYFDTHVNKYQFCTAEF